MVKRSAKTKTTKRATPRTTVRIHSGYEVENILIENFVALQKVMTNFSIKFDNLTKQISKLLELFEISAKTLAEKGLDTESNTSNKKVIEKIESLLEQNKIIARGLTLIHERIPGQENPEEFPEETQTQMPPLQKSPPIMGGYQRSISSDKVLESPSTQIPGKENAQSKFKPLR